MAIVTKTLAERENGLVRIEADYDDATEVIQALRWRNDWVKPVRAQLTRADTGTQVVNVTLAPGQTGSRNLPGAQRFRLDQYGISL